MKRDLSTVHFQFDSKEDAFRGCAKLKAVHDTCFTTWYEEHFLEAAKLPAGSAAARDKLAADACNRETALYQKCLAAKLNALGLSQLTTKSLAKDDV